MESLFANAVVAMALSGMHIQQATARSRAHGLAISLFLVYIRPIRAGVTVPVLAKGKTHTLPALFLTSMFSRMVWFPCSIFRSGL